MKPNHPSNQQAWVQKEIESWLIQSRTSIKLKQKPLGIFVMPEHVEKMYEAMEEREKVRERELLARVEARQRLSLESKKTLPRPVSETDSFARQENSKVTSKISDALPRRVASDVDIQGLVKKSGETLSGPMARLSPEEKLGTATVGTARGHKIEIPTSKDDLSRQLTDLSMSVVMEESSQFNASSQNLRSSEVAHKDFSAEVSPQFDFSFESHERSDRSLVGRSVRFFLAHFIDLSLVVVSMMVSLVLGFFVFVFDASLGIAAGQQFSSWLPVRLVAELNLVEAFFFFYALFIVYWAFFKMFVGATIGSSIFSPASSLESSETLSRTHANN